MVCYSHTGNTAAIVKEMGRQTGWDVLQVTPAEEGLDYAANNYAIGSAQISAIKNDPGNPGSYPEVNASQADLSQYSTIVVATPLWWSQMAAPMQSFLFGHSSELAGKNIALVVSSHSSGISGVADDAKRLVPDGKFTNTHLWIKNSQMDEAGNMVAEWIKENRLNSQQQAMNIYITANGTTMRATLASNTSAQALFQRLEESDVTYTAQDYGNFEKVGDLGFSLPTNNEQITTKPGDLILYQGRKLCIYYDTNTWDFTRIGRIEGMAQQELKQALGTGGVTVTLSLKAAQAGTPATRSTANATRRSGDTLFTIGGRPLRQEPENGIYIKKQAENLQIISAKVLPHSTTRPSAPASSCGRLSPSTCASPLR